MYIYNTFLATFNSTNDTFMIAMCTCGPLQVGSNKVGALPMTVLVFLLLACNLTRVGKLNAAANECCVKPPAEQKTRDLRMSNK